MRHTILFVACAITLHSVAQVTLETTAAGPMRVLLSLTAGPKLMDQDWDLTGDVNIYNMDMSIHRTLVLPTPPAGYSWSSMWYVTEALFDTDPTTLEYILTASGGLPGQSAMGVYREDGTAIFTKIPGQISGGLGVDPFNSFPPIFQTPSGAKMLLQGSFGAPTEVYALAGDVPCISSCFPTAQSNFSSGVDEFVGTSGRLHVQNPASGLVTVQLTLPVGASEGDLIVVDAAGRITLHMPGIRSGSHTVDVSGMAPGQYFVHVRSKGGILPTAPMTVLR